MSDEQKDTATDAVYFGSSVVRPESPAQHDRLLLTRYATDAARSISGLAGDQNGINELQKWLDA